jgi:membrane protein
MATVELDGNQPQKPTDLSRRAWFTVFKRTVKEFKDDNLSDLAAALTYYSVLSIFPGLLVLFSVFGLLPPKTADAVTENLLAIVPHDVLQPLDSVLKQLQDSKAAGILAIVGVLTALWSASGYVSAFMRAANVIYDVPEGRPIWKTLPTRLGVTIVVGILIGLAGLSVVFTGKFAEQLGKPFGIGKQAVQVWDWVKWPVLLVVLMIVLAVLYWASPNARQAGIRWVTPGGIIAVLGWVAVSALFALYLATFASYSKTYGTLGGVIAFLVWLWISNLVILFGAEFDAELERERAIEGGVPATQEPYLPLRDDRKVDDGALLRGEHGADLADERGHLEGDLPDVGVRRGDGGQARQ